MRGFSGWLALVLVLLLMAGTQMAEYLNRESSSSITSDEREVRSAMTQVRLSNFLKSTVAPKKDYLGDTAKELDAKPRSPKMAELRVALGILRKEPPLEADLKLLRKGDKDQKWLASSSGELQRTTPKNKALAYRIADAMNDAYGDQAKALETLVPSSKVIAFFATVLLILALGFGSLVVWAFFLVTKPPVVPHPIGELTQESGNRLAGMIAMALVVMLFLLPLVASTIPKGLRPPLVLGAIQVVVFCAAVFPIVAEYKGLLRFANTFWKDLTWACGGFLVNVAFLGVSLMISQVLTRWMPAPEHPASVRLAENPSLMVIAMTFFSAVILAPIFEELLFRGALLPAVIGATKSRFWGFFLTNLAFAVIHPTGVPAWPALMMTGVASSLVIYRSGSLRASMLMHAMHNGLILCIALLVT